MKSKAPRRKSYHHGDLKNALIEVALQQISREGVRALSLRDVARRAGVSHTASYRHFSSKESLLAAIAEQGFRRLGEALRAAIEPHADDPVAALKASGLAYVEFGVSSPEHLEVMFSSQLTHEDYPAVAEASKEAYAQLTSVVHEGFRSGGLRGADERSISLAAWSMVHGLTQLISSGQLESRNPPAATVRAMALAVTTLLHRGIEAPAVPPPAERGPRARK